MSDVNVYAKKRYGQNFLKDESLLKKIVEASGVSKDTLVLEIGPGLGALTKYLCRQAGLVVAYEIDDDLIPILKNNLSEYKNLEIIHQDILKADILQDIQQYRNQYKEVRVVANLPYYITTPILMKLLFMDLGIQSLTVMMQLEVANRICGKPSTKDYNALSVLIAYKGLAKKVLNVARTYFTPVPNVDSAVVYLELYKEPMIQPINEQFFFHLIENAFRQRRKTLYNNLSNEFDKEKILEMLASLGLNTSIRAEALTLEDFIHISDYLTQN